MLVADITMGQARLYTGRNFEQANLALAEAIDCGEVAKLFVAGPDGVVTSLRDWAATGGFRVDVASS